MSNHPTETIISKGVVEDNVTVTVTVETPTTGAFYLPACLHAHIPHPHPSGSAELLHVRIFDHH
jgi:hypothetical protein